MCLVSCAVVLGFDFVGYNSKESDSAPQKRVTEVEGEEEYLN